MEAVLVDTDVFSFLWKTAPRRPYRPLVTGRIVVLSFTSIAEAHYGARKRRWGERQIAELEAALSQWRVGGQRTGVGAPTRARPACGDPPAPGEPAGAHPAPAMI